MISTTEGVFRQMTETEQRAFVTGQDMAVEVVYNPWWHAAPGYVVRAA